ncbi:MAG: bifunctional phosphoribosylaminoimidazolecarboxamide formyltransferase/IMP cyclohydrolase [Candidatus Dormibacteraeota bacterium]|nr:bifunctional phosphoribosylaminoimidazolecarboxamide formyltransferase/IMP cyclohydrolase [Candidatus Dormibacteraeota bacterium]
MTVRALIGVSDKTGLAEFAGALQQLGVDIVATDGTRRALLQAGVESRAVSELTGFPEMLDGRVKTLHPAVHAGILARRDDAAHMRQLAERGFEPFDIVAVSLYPFAETAARGAGEDAIVENIDIGGPTMIRAAAKNSASVAVVVSPAQYDTVIAELRENGEVGDATRRRLAAEAFAHTAAYDTAVAAQLRRMWVADDSLPAQFTTGGERLHELRYGENPHQRGALYAVPGAPGGVAHARQLQGSPLSFTNWLDVDSALRLVSDFDVPAACVIKHTNPCGFAVGDSAAVAYQRAFDCDPRAAYGGIVGVNRTVDLATAERVAATFLEALVCPGIEDDAAARLAAKPRLRVLVVDRPAPPHPDVRSIDGGLLVQTQDRVLLDRAAMTVATQRAPDDAEWADLLVAWQVCRHVKSNAVVVVNGGMAVGVGAGQMSRVEAAELAVARAAARAQGAAAASDAFFPMPDGLEPLGRAGVRSVIHPGGSKQDPAVVAAADALGMAVVHAGERHFRH